MSEREGKAAQRRRFLRDGALGTSLAWAASTAAQAGVDEQKVPGANERIRLGLIGCGGQGRFNLRTAMKSPQVQVVSLCDIDESRLDGTAVEVERKYSSPPARHMDYRALLDQTDLDAVLIATPDHWHAAPTMAACAAGKDVYVEKPVGHNIREGRKMVEAARRHDRVVQVGTQQRSGAHFQKAVEMVRGGVLGKVTVTRTFNFTNEAPEGIGPGKSVPPAGIDYDRWLGPAPLVPYNSNRFHYNWRWFFDYAAGMVGDWNVHLQDIVHWAMGQEHPRAVSASGDKFALDDNRDTPDTMEAVFDFDGFVQIYSMRKTNAYAPGGKRAGIYFHGTKGTLFVDRGGWELYTEENRGAVAERSGTSAQYDPHMENFFDCLRSRNRPISDIETAHHTTTACHLANIALRLGRKLHWDHEQERIVDSQGQPDESANAYLGREYRAGYELPTV